MSLQELKYLPFEVLDVYLYLLHKNPVITKSVTSAVIGGLGDAVFQLAIKKSGIASRSSSLSYQSIAAIAGCGLFVTGPMSHYFFIILDKYVPPNSKFATVARVLIDRLLFAPLYLLVLLYVRYRLEGLEHKAALRRIRKTYLPILKMSFRVWSIAQYFNLNYIPQKYRVLFANFIALGWNVYLAAMKKETSRK